MIIILGMAGAGKSTQCRSLSVSDNFQWVAVGELIRKSVSGEDRAEMLHGMVLDDSVVKPLVQAELDRVGNNPEILLDGCPRTREQAEWLATASTTPKVRAVLHLVISEAETIKRLEARGRVDDTPEAIRRRIDGYHKDIEPVLNEFASRNIPVITIDANPDQQTVLQSIQKELRQI